MVKKGFRVEFSGEKDEYRGEFSNFTFYQTLKHQAKNSKQTKKLFYIFLQKYTKTISSTFPNQMNGIEPSWSTIPLSQLIKDR